jgi:3-deoxy-D-manno-octulosonic acid kinase
MINRGQRTATATGVMLADPHDIGDALQSDPGSLFDPNFWAARGQRSNAMGGRGAAWFVGTEANPWVLRHYRRGGYISPLISPDRYLWMGEERVRSFAEWRMLDYLAQRGLPVPPPVAAWYRREGLTYHCDLLTRRVAGAECLTAALTHAAQPLSVWQKVGAAIARLHGAGADHADLTANNILLGSQHAVTVVDFDRGRLRAPGEWSQMNLQRLHRSLRKVSKNLPPDRFTPAAWNGLLEGYRAVG